MISQVVIFITETSCISHNYDNRSDILPGLKPGASFSQGHANALDITPNLIRKDESSGASFLSCLAIQYIA